MEANKTIAKQELVNMYMDFVLEKATQPKSVYIFAKENNFEEAHFYKYFNSFETLENAIFEIFYEHTITLLLKSEDYESFDSRNKLLSFYFTFFEILTANRSYVIYSLQKDKGNLKSMKKLSGFRKLFLHYIDELNIETLDVKQEKLEKIQQKTIQESAWIQLLTTIKFWIEDTSPSFEKTDIFIEKSVNTSFDLLDTKPLKSIIDFGKFIYKEKMMQK